MDRVVWRLTAAVGIILQKYHDFFGERDTYDMNQSEFMITHGPSYSFVDEKKRQNSPGKL